MNLRLHHITSSSLIGVATLAVLSQVPQATLSEAATDRLRRVTQATLAYAADNDGGMPFSNRGGFNISGWGYGRPDYLTFELVMPYGPFGLADSATPYDPRDWSNRSLSSISGTPRPPGHPNYEYAIASRTNWGYNSYFMSPWILWTGYPGGGGTYIGSAPINTFEVTTLSRTLVFLESIRDRNGSTGVPQGGGNWIVQAPCVLDGNNVYLDPIRKWRAAGRWKSYRPIGWNVGAVSWLEFGGMWPWAEGKVLTSTLDGSAKRRSIAELSEGCDVVRGGRGFAFDGEAYLWDLR